MANRPPPGPLERKSQWPIWLPPLDERVLDVETWSGALSAEISRRVLDGATYKEALFQVVSEAHAAAHSARTSEEES